MSQALQRLLSIASTALVDSAKNIDVSMWGMANGHARDLAHLLSQRNGFFAFEGALHVLPTCSVTESYGLADWNVRSLWRDEYADLAENCFFFAEDIFGSQFCVSDDCIKTFDPETGQLDLVAEDLEGWAAALLSDYEVLTGHRIAHDWQAAHGQLAGRQRLVPKIPFVCGGEFLLSNLIAMDAAKGMRARGNLALQIRNLPDGAKIRFEITP